MSSMPDIFISHASGDKGLIKPIALALIRQGYSLFIDRPDELGWTFPFCRDHNVSFLMGGDFGAQLRDAVRESKVILGCLSRNLCNERAVWKEELMVGEHDRKLVLCRVDDVPPETLDAVDTGTVQLERLQSRPLRLASQDPLDEVAPEIIEGLLNDPAFSFVLYEIERLCGGAGAEAPSAQPIAPQAPQAVSEPLPEQPAPDAGPQRVAFTFPPEMGGGALPFVIKVMSDLGQPEDYPPLYERAFDEVDYHSFHDFLRGTRPRIQTRVQNVLESADGSEVLLAVDLEIRSMDDFTPSGIARQIPATRALLERRTAIARLIPLMDGKPEAKSIVMQVLDDPDLMKSVIEAQCEEDEDGYRTDWFDGRNTFNGDDIDILGDLYAVLMHRFRPRSDMASIEVARAIGMLCELALETPYAISQSPSDSIQALCARLDALLSAQIRQVMRDERFQQVEAAWRGLHHLLTHVPDSTREATYKVRVLNVSKRELVLNERDYPGAEMMRSPLAQKLHEDAYGMLGGEPPTCIVGDYHISHAPADIALLRNMSVLAAATHAPFLAGASPDILQMDHWQELPRPSRLAHIVEADEYAAWHSLRDDERTRYLALTCPRFMARAPYGYDNPDADFAFEEEPESEKPDHFCWANSAYVLASGLARAFARDGWLARLTGPEAGPSIDTLPLVPVFNERGAHGTVCPVEAPVSIARQREMSDIGLIPLMYQRGSPMASFVSLTSVHRPLLYDDAQFQAGIDGEIHLQRFFPANQITQYLCCILRDLGGTFTQTNEVEDFLSAWLANYVAGTSDGVSAARPLVDAFVEIVPSRAGGGQFDVRVSVTPGYQVKGDKTPVRTSCPLNL